MGLAARASPRRPRADPLRWGIHGRTMTFLAPKLLEDRALADSFMRYERQSASPGMAKAMIGWLYEVDVRHVLPRSASRRWSSARRSHAYPSRARSLHREHVEGAASSNWPAPTTTPGPATPSPMLARSRSSSPALADGRARPRPRHGSVHRHRRLDRGWPASSATRAGATCSARTTRHPACPGPIPRREIKTTATGSSPPSMGRPARSAPRSPSVTRSRRRIRGALRASYRRDRAHGVDIAGIAVHIAARVSALAGGGEILTSNTVKGLVAGPGIVFEPRGSSSSRASTTTGWSSPPSGRSIAACRSPWLPRVELAERTGPGS